MNLSLVISLILLFGICIFEIKAGCFSCLQCLPNVNNDSWTSTGFVFDNGGCPTQLSQEYYYLQQLLMLYPPPYTNTQAPCFSACLSCVQTIKTQCPHIASLGTSPWQKTYNGLFSPQYQAKGKTDLTYSMSANVYPPGREYGKVYGHSSGKGPIFRGKRTADHCCKTESILASFLTKLDNCPYYPVWFRDITSDAIYCQHFEQVSCRDPSCNVQPTHRTMLITTHVPDSEYGHSYFFFNGAICRNIQFVTVKVPGYCACVN